jgi:hypothetical protein
LLFPLRANKKKPALAAGGWYGRYADPYGHAAAAGAAAAIADDHTFLALKPDEATRRLALESIHILQTLKLPLP